MSVEYSSRNKFKHNTKYMQGEGAILALRRCGFARFLVQYTLVPSVFVPLDQRSGNSDKPASAVRDEDSRYEIGCSKVAVLRFYKPKRFAVFRNFRVISMWFVVFLYYYVRCLYVFLCRFAVFVSPLPPQLVLKMC